MPKPIICLKNIMKIFFMEVLTQAYSHVVNDAVYEQTAQTLDSVYATLTQKKNQLDSVIV